MEIPDDWLCPACYYNLYTLCNQGSRWWARCHRCQADSPLQPEPGSYRLRIVPDPLVTGRY